MDWKGEEQRVDWSELKQGQRVNTSVACCGIPPSGRDPTVHTELDADNNRDLHSGKLDTATPLQCRQSDCRLSRLSYVNTLREELHSESCSADHKGCRPSC